MSKVMSKKALSLLSGQVTELVQLSKERKLIEEREGELKEAVKSTLRDSGIIDFKVDVDGVDWKAGLVSQSRSSLDKEGLTKEVGIDVINRYTSHKTIELFVLRPLK